MTNLFGFNVDNAISAMGDKFAAFNGGNNPFGAAGPESGNPFGAGITQGGNPFGASGLQGGNAFGPTGPQGGNAFGVTGPVGGNAFGVTGPAGGSAFGATGPTGGNPFQVLSAAPVSSVHPTKVPTSTATGPSAGMEPGVAKWAGKTAQVFGDISGLDPDTMLAIMTNESHGDPNAYNAAGDAWGLFQNVGLKSNDPDAQFAAAHQLALDKMKDINTTYAKLGINPDARTRARDFALAWGGQFDYATGQPATNRPDVGSGQLGPELAAVFLKNYDAIKAGRTAPAASAAPGSVVAAAQKYTGVPYQLGGLRSHPDNPMAGIDCSEFTAKAYKDATGKDLPWNAQQQYNVTQRIGQQDLQPGDLVFFQGTDPSDPDTVTHVGMYIGNNQMINAQDGGVMVADLNSSYWAGHTYGYGRVR